MANEATIRTSLQVKSAARDWRSDQLAGNFSATVSVPDKGPKPGGVTVSTSGTDIDLSGLVSPGLAWIQNFDSTYSLFVGIRDASSNLWYPLIEVPPKCAYPVFLSRKLGYEYTGTGTGSSGDKLNLRSDAPTSIQAYVGAFER